MPLCGSVTENKKSEQSTLRKRTSSEIQSQMCRLVPALGSQSAQEPYFVIHRLCVCLPAHLSLWGWGPCLWVTFCPAWSTAAVTCPRARTARSARMLCFGLTHALSLPTAIPVPRSAHTLPGNPELFPRETQSVSHLLRHSKRSCRELGFAA